MRFTSTHLAFFATYSSVFLLVVFLWPFYTLNEFRETREAVFGNVPQNDVIAFTRELTNERIEDLQIHVFDYSLYGVFTLQPSNKEGLFDFDVPVSDSPSFSLSIYTHSGLKNPPWRKFCHIAGPELRCYFEEDKPEEFDVLPLPIVESARNHKKVKDMYFKHFIYQHEKGSIITSGLIILAITTLLALLNLLWYFLNILQRKKGLRNILFFLLLVLGLGFWIEVLYPMHAAAGIMGWVVFIGLFTPYAVVTFAIASGATFVLYKLGLFFWGRLIGVAKRREKITLFAIALFLILYIVGLPALIYFAGGSPPID